MTTLKIDSWKFHNQNEEIINYYWNNVEPFVNGSNDKKALKMINDKFRLDLKNKELTNILYKKEMLK